MTRRLTAFLFLAALLALGTGGASAQGVTTSSVSGTVTSQAGRPLADVAIVAVHVPSGTRYSALSRGDGRFFIPGMRVGGPYTVTASIIGFQTQSQEQIFLTLGVASDLAFVLQETALVLEGITVTGQADAVFSSERTGAATTVTREALANIPTIDGRLASVARLTPQFGGGFSFAGQDNRLNNITVDGSYFNNSFGLGGQPGDRTGVAPISLNAIEQVQINIAPYDVRQGNFVGAGVNTVTRSGTNEFKGFLEYQFRDNSFVGTKAGGADIDPGNFDYSQIGGWLAGPIIPNRLFFFVNYENEGLTEPGTTYRANRGNEPVGGGVVRPTESDLNQLRTFLRENFNYETGPYQGYDHETPATRFLAKLDFNLDDRNKLSLRYSHLDSSTDVLLSNSGSLGFPNRRFPFTTGLNFQNSNYQILENIRSIVGEWNSIIGPNMANNLILGYTTHDESRASRGDFFPMVDILEAGSVYTTFGFEPFTPNNELRYSSFQLQNNFTRFGERHTLTFGVSAERYESENVFFPGSQSVYSYNSLADFYLDATGYLANPNRTTSPVTLRRFQVRYSNIPGQDKPIQPLEVFYAGVYAQDEWQVNRDLKVTIGARVDVPFFGQTAYTNANADALTFRDEKGNPVRYSTGKLPDPNPLFSPRIGFNWDVMGDRTTQVRGGTGIFTGRPAYVWISNQIGNTGVLTGFEQLENTTARPFHPDPNRYKPTNVTGAPATSYELALTDPDFKFPQLWRTNLAVDQRLPWGLVGTLEGLYNRDVNGIYYINANLPAAQSTFTGADNRPRWVGPSCAQPTAGPCVTRIHNTAQNRVSNAIVLKNQNVGYSWNIAATLEKPFDRGFYAKLGYSYGESKNTVDPGSIAFGSWNGNAHSGDPNNPGLGFSVNSPGHRLFGAVSYRAEYFDFGATSISLFASRFSPGNGSWRFQGDMNGDGGTANDLIYIHRDQSEMNFVPFTVGGRTFTAAEQAAAWDRFIDQDPYLSKNRGRYAERNAAFIPMINRVDLSVTQEIFTNLAGRRNALQLRADILNVMNLLNSDWGVGKNFVNQLPLIVASPAVDADGRPRYTLRAINGELMSESFEPTAGLGDVWRLQVGLRYLFNTRN